MYYSDINALQNGYFPAAGIGIANKQFTKGSTKNNLFEFNNLQANEAEEE